MKKLRNENLYRLGVGIMITNIKDEILIFQRQVKLKGGKELIKTYWQMPQGGVEEYDNNAYSTAIRELKEETGIEENQIELITSIPYLIYYDIPQRLLNKNMHNKHIGQKQYWYIFQIKEDKKDIDLNKATDKQFLNYKWASQNEVIKEGIYFKQKLYKKIFDFFNEYKSASEKS